MPAHGDVGGAQCGLRHIQIFERDELHASRSEGRDQRRWIAGFGVVLRAVDQARELVRVHEKRHGFQVLPQSRFERSDQDVLVCFPVGAGSVDPAFHELPGVLETLVVHEKRDERLPAAGQDVEHPAPAAAAAVSLARQVKGFPLTPVLIEHEETLARFRDDQGSERLRIRRVVKADQGHGQSEPIDQGLGVGLFLDHTLVISSFFAFHNDFSDFFV